MLVYWGSGQVTNFIIAGGTAKRWVYQYMVLFRSCSQGGDTAMPCGRHALPRISSSLILCVVLCVQITKLKIDSNPFAKGFRDSSRLCDFDR